MANGFATNEDYYELARRDLPGLFGATASLSAVAQSRVTRRWTPQTTRIRIPGGTHVVRLHRGSRAFSTIEMQLQETYGEALEELSKVPAGFARTASADVLTHAIAARCAHEVPDQADVLEDVMRLVVEQATKTYEGARIAVNVCVDLTTDGVGQSLTDFFGQPWSAVLGSGLSTGVMVDGSGRVIGLQNLPDVAGVDVFAPQPFVALARWTDDPGRVALAATRTGEIYVFANGLLHFAFRNSQWRGFPLEALAGTSWFTSAGGIPRETKTAALLSLIDASAAHHGACLGIVRAGSETPAVNRLVAGAERWSSDDNPRRHVIDATNFLTLSRRQRLEMLSMDGATIITRTGQILAAGAILKVGGGSTGGGRTAAARAVGRFGVGIKVSQDGPVTAYAGNVEAAHFTMG